MDHVVTSENELQVLRALCGETASRAQRAELLHSLEGHVFLDTENEVVFESIRSLFARGGVSEARLTVHLNNRGFPDVDLEKYFPAKPKKSESGFSTRTAAIVLGLAALAAVLVSFARPLRQFIRESFMQRVTSAHYEVLCPPGAIFPDAMRQFAAQRESLFTTLDRKLNDAASNAEIRVIFYPDSSAPVFTGSAPYEVAGTTIRARINGPNGPAPQLDPAADAEALLHVAWGNPGNARVGKWTATWLVGEWRGEELGMAAAAVEQRLGHKRVSTLLDPSSNEISSPEDRTLLGAAWLSEIAELDGPAEVRKLYSAKMPAFNVAEVTKTLGTTPLELDRKWQMWMFAYLAGMPSPSHSMHMEMQ